MKARALLFMLGGLFFALPLFASAATLTASPVSGTAPLTVNFTAAGLTPGTTYTTSWGDGVTSTVPPQTAPSSGRLTFGHTYTTAGSFVAKVLGPSSVVTASTTVTVTAAQAAAPSCVLTLSAPSVVYGNQLTLSWSSQRATAGSITGVGSVGASGSARVSPGTSGTYTGTFTGTGGTGRCTVSVTVTQNNTTLGVSTVPFNDIDTTDNGITIPDATFRGVPDVYSNVTNTNQPSTVTQTQSNTQTQQSSGTKGLVGCNSAEGCNLCAFTKLFQSVINFLIGLTVPLSALLFAWAGILYFTSMGSEERAKKAKKIFTSVALGLVIAMGGWLGVQTLLKTVLAPGYYQTWNEINCQQGNRPGTNGFFSTVSQWLSLLPPTNSTTLTQSTGGSSYQCGNDSAGQPLVLSGGSCYTSDGTYVKQPTVVLTSANSGYTCPGGYSLAGGQCYNNDNPSLPTVTPTALGSTQTIGNFTCTNCMAIPSDIPGYNRSQSCSQQVGGACQADAGLIQSLQGLKSSLSSTDYSNWYVSEAWPPTVTHQSSDQNAGSSVDISACNSNNGVSGTSAIGECVQTFQGVASQNNLRAVYEVPDAASRTAILQANPSLTSTNVIVVSGVSPHFSIYKK